MSTALEFCPLKQNRPFHCNNIMLLCHKLIGLQSSVMPEPRGRGSPGPPPIFGRSVNPISTRDVGSTHPLLLAPQKFFTFRHPCYKYGFYLILVICQFYFGLVGPHTLCYCAIILVFKCTTMH